MFVLKRRLLAWRAEMLARGVFSPGEVLELEDHLTAEAEHLVAQGTSDREAFVEAMRRLGGQDLLAAEYSSAHRLSTRRRLMPLAWVFRQASHLCGLVRGMVILMLPGMVVAVPAATMGIVYRDMIDEMMPGEPLPGLSGLALRLSAFICRFWPLALLIALAILFLPAAYRAWQLQARGEFTLAGWFAEESRGARRLLPAALLLYPFVAYVFIVAFFAPLFRLISKLGS